MTGQPRMLAELVTGPWASAQRYVSSPVTPRPMGSWWMAVRGRPGHVASASPSVGGGGTGAGPAPPTPHGPDAGPSGAGDGEGDGLGGAGAGGSTPSHVPALVASASLSSTDGTSSAVNGERKAPRSSSCGRPSSAAGERSAGRFDPRGPELRLQTLRSGPFGPQVPDRLGGRLPRTHLVTGPQLVAA